MVVSSGSSRLPLHYICILKGSFRGANNRKFSVATIPNRIFPPIFIAFEQLDGEGKKWETYFWDNPRRFHLK